MRIPMNLQLLSEMDALDKKLLEDIDVFNKFAPNIPDEIKNRIQYQFQFGTLEGFINSLSYFCRSLLHEMMTKEELIVIDEIEYRIDDNGTIKESPAKYGLKKD